MKKLSLIIALLSPVLLFAQVKRKSQAGLPFVIEGTVSSQKTPAKAFLAIRMPDFTSGLTIVDSADVRQGHFTFRGTIPEPVMAVITLKPQGKVPVRPGAGNQLSLFLDTGTITVKAVDTIGKAVVTGSPANDANEALKRALKGITDRVVIKEICADYVKNNPASPIAVYVLNTNFGAYYFDIDKLGPLYDRLAPAVKSTPSGIEFGQRLTTFRNTAVGALAPKFSLPDVSGKMIGLDSYKGKYVFVDFWASWCHPCRAETPYIAKAYATYKTKGFEVLSISLDSQRKNWEEAVKKDGMIWMNVSDLKGAENEISKQYGIAGIPKSFLIDPSGKIIARNLRGDALDKKLEEVFAH